MPEYEKKLRRRNVITALVLAAVAVGFYIAIFVKMGMS